MPRAWAATSLLSVLVTTIFLCTFLSARCTRKRFDKYDKSNFGRSAAATWGILYGEFLCIGKRRPS